MAVPVQMGLTKHAEFPNIPNAYELVSNEGDRQLFRLIFGPWSYGRPLFAPPGTAPDRIAVLRAAMAAVVKDPAYLAETKKMNLIIEPMTGERLQEIVNKTVSAPPNIIARTKQVLEWN